MQFWGSYKNVHDAHWGSCKNGHDAHWGSCKNGPKMPKKWDMHMIMICKQTYVMHFICNQAHGDAMMLL